MGIFLQELNVEIMPPLSIFASLLAAHLLGDFIFQTRAMAEAKSRLELGPMLTHFGIHGLLVWLLIGGWGAATMGMTIFVVHGLIDSTKELANNHYLLDRKSPRAGLAVFGVDQLLHIASLWWLSGVALYDINRTSWWEDVFGTHWFVMVHVIIVVIIAVPVGSIVIGYFVGPWLNELNAARASRGEDKTRSSERGFSDGGRTIGQLERLLIVILVLVNSIGGVGFLIAAKSIFRFGELQQHEDRMEAEYIIIGTLLSFAWGLGATLCYWYFVASSVQQHVAEFVSQYQ